MAEFDAKTPAAPGAPAADFLVSRAILIAISGFAMAISGFVTVGLWVSILYLVLQQIGASSTIWTLFWCYVPVTLITNILATFIKSKADEVAEQLKGMRR